MESFMLVMPACLFVLLVLIISIQVSKPFFTFFVHCLAAFLPVIIFLLLIMVLVCRELKI
jgi:hypothetical protein